jgi:hypothetical protein
MSKTRVINDFLQRRALEYILVALRAMLYAVIGSRCHAFPNLVALELEAAIGDSCHIAGCLIPGVTWSFLGHGPAPLCFRVLFKG